MATTTYADNPSDGSQIKRGTCVIQDGQTINTALGSVSGIVVSCSNADTVATVSALSGSSATVDLRTAGNIPAGNRTVYWEAWSNQGV